jgi:hypothetical protein
MNDKNTYKVERISAVGAVEFYALTLGLWG